MLQHTFSKVSSTFEKLFICNGSHGSEIHLYENCSYEGCILCKEGAADEVLQSDCVRKRLVNSLVWITLFYGA